VAQPIFQPGFRFSIVDGIVIVVGSIASIVFWSDAGWIAFVIAFVVAHFFLFCNIFRLARPLELLWSFVFILLSFCTITFEKPSWLITIAGSLLTTAVVVAAEMREPSYHGILWQRINPTLPQWWAAEAHAKLVEVLREARSLLAIPGNDFAWSSWADAAAALTELDQHIATIEKGELPPELDLTVLFAPTGPIQEVSLSSGWADEFLALAARFDRAAARVWA
jgi:hypothetical protein